MPYKNYQEVLMNKEEHKWDELISSYKVSGLDMREFCKLNEVSYGRFRYHWYKQDPADRVLNFNQDNIINPARFESIVIEPPAAIEQKCQDIELVIYLPNQIRCEIKKGMTQEVMPSFLKQLVSLC